MIPRNGVSPRNSVPPRHTDNTDDDGFVRNKHDIKKDQKREVRHQKVVYGTKNVAGSRFNGGHRESTDLSVYHVNHSATVGDLKGLATPTVPVLGRETRIGHMDCRCVTIDKHTCIVSKENRY